MKMKTKKPNSLEQILRMVDGNPVTYHPALKFLVGSVHGALYLSHLLYWDKKGFKGEWTYKTIKEIERETGLTRSRQDTALRQCLEKGLLDYRRMGIPAKRHFKINMPRITAIILSLQESGKLGKPKPSNSTNQNQQTNTETTIRDYTNNKETNFEGLRRLKELKENNFKK